jgi:hypothetical protein
MKNVLIGAGGQARRLAMRAPVDVIFPAVQAGLVPYWRLVLRGCSQL